MKKILLMLLLTFSFATVQAATIVTAVLTPGFIQNPETRTFLLDSSGFMQMKILTHQTGAVRFVRLGQLSAYAINKLRAEVQSLDVRSPLVDDDAGGPICTDAPKLSISIIKNRVKTEIFRKANCHEFHLMSYEGQRVIKLAMGFIEL